MPQPLSSRLLSPGLGGFIFAPIIFASTIAIGAVARVFFDRNGELSSAEMHTIYKQTVKNARRSFDPKRAQSDTAQDMAQ